MTDDDFREHLRAKAREKYDQALRWADSDLRHAMRFADQADIHRRDGTLWADKRWRDGSYEHTFGYVDVG